MTHVAKLAFIAAVAIGTAAPALAQSYDPEFGRGAYDMVPPVYGGSALHPGATGGGSYGYNENLRRDAW
jgi:hypothetical protein